MALVICYLCAPEGATEDERQALLALGDWCPSCKERLRIAREQKERAATEALEADGRRAAEAFAKEGRYIDDLDHDRRTPTRRADVVRDLTPELSAEMQTAAAAALAPWRGGR